MSELITGNLKGAMRHKNSLSGSMPQYLQTQHVPTINTDFSIKKRKISAEKHFGIMISSLYSSLGISKEWSPIMINSSSLIHDLTHDSNGSLSSIPYIEVHSRENTLKKIREVELRRVVDEINSQVTLRNFGGTYSQAG